ALISHGNTERLRRRRRRIVVEITGLRCSERARARSADVDEVSSGCAVAQSTKAHCQPRGCGGANCKVRIAVGFGWQRAKGDGLVLLHYGSLAVIQQNGNSTDRQIRLTIPIEVSGCDHIAAGTEGQCGLETALAIAQEQFIRTPDCDIRDAIAIEISNHNLRQRPNRGVKKDRVPLLKRSISVAEKDTNRSVANI